MPRDESLTQAKELELFVETTIRPLVSNPLVLQAFKKVDRRNFVPKKYSKFAYADEPIDLTESSSISQPAVVAIMADHLGLTGKEKVLEIGTASGFNAAILSQCSSHVHTIEIDEGLARESSERLRNLGYANISVHVGDGALGLPTEAPFNAIIVTASVKSIPSALLGQLADGGKIVVPIGKVDPTQSILIEGKKIEGRISFSEIAEVSFYPLISPQEGGWKDEEVKKFFSLRKAMLKQMANLPDLDQHMREMLEILSKIAGRPIITPQEANEFLSKNPQVMEELRKRKA